MYPNSALPAWQLIVMISLAVGFLLLWITVVHLAGREHRTYASPPHPRRTEAEAAADEVTWKNAA